MTSSRAMRGTKAKIFLYVCAILAITGLIACYNNILTQLDEVKKSKDICQQEHDNLSTQLQVISDYKQKLEKSLKTEKAEHQQSKNALEIKINEEKNRNQKITNDALIKYNSLQQHYKLLQAEHDDFKEENGKTRKKQAEEVNSLLAKIKEIEEELKKVRASKESLKTQFTELELENIQLKLLQKNNATAKFYSEEYRILEDKFRALQNKCEPSEEPPMKPSEKAVLHVPAFKRAENPSSSTKSLPKILPSSSTKGNNLNFLPQISPSATPETLKKEVNLKAPQGVVEPPENREDQNEQPQVQMDQKLSDDNNAREVFDGPIVADGLNFADEKINAVEQKNEGKKRYEQDYKDLQHEEEGDDDADEYGDRHVRGAEVAIRN